MGVDEVRETVLHEIAHALVGPRHGHDRVWRAKALAIGASGERCYDAGKQPVVPGRWQGRCPTGHVVHRHRRPSTVLVCVRCGTGSPMSRVLAWKLEGRPVSEHELGPRVVEVMAHLRATG